MTASNIRYASSSNKVIFQRKPGHVWGELCSCNVWETAIDISTRLNLLNALTETHERNYNARCK